MPEQIVGPHRRPHRKSKTGCQQCKLRKIKCDEHKPNCNRCVRFATPCIYLNTTPSSPPSSQIPPTTTPPTPASLITCPPIPSTIPSPLPIQTLELLYHFTTTTSTTLSNLPHQRKIWTVVVPQLAFAHPFLLHLILALSAIHLGRLVPPRRPILCPVATQHHTLGIGLFRSVMEEGGIVRENCAACFAASTLLVIYAWSSSCQTGDLFFVDSGRGGEEGEGKGTVEWVSLLRGCHKLLALACGWLKEGMLAGLLLVEAEVDGDVRGDAERIAKFTALKSLWHASQSSRRLGVAEVNALDEALGFLVDVYAQFSQHREQIDEVGTVLSWAIRVSDLYIRMVSQLRPEALVVLAHYSLLLNMIDGYWFMAGMSRCLLGAIHKRLGQGWERWIEWPLRESMDCEIKDGYR